MTSDKTMPPVPIEVLVGDPRDTRPMMAWTMLVVTLSARVYRSFLLTLVMAAVVPMLWSWSDYVVRSGSMEPAISVGDVVVAKPFASSEQVPVGRVMIFSNPATPEHPELLVHRVVEKLDTGAYTTAGDANISNDTTPVTSDLFRARATILVPFVGKPFTWWASGNVVALLAWVLLTALCFVPKRRRPQGPRGGGGLVRRLMRLRFSPGSLPVMPGASARSGALRPIARLVSLPALVSAVTLVVVSTGSASAAFTATTANRSMSWTVSPTLTTNLVLTPPGDPVRGTVPVTATLANSYGLTFAVRIDYAPAGTTSWQSLCTRSAAPYTCDWATPGYANQDYDLRAVATSGTTTYTSRVVGGVSVDNAAPTVTMQDPGSPLRGRVTLATSATDAQSGVSRVVVQYAATGSTIWQTACTATQQPWSCGFDTATVPAGSYSLRAVATDVAGNASTSAVVAGRVIDNSVSTITMNDPGSYLSGTVLLSATASSSAGVASVRIQGAPAGSAAWSDLCTDTTSPYSCSYNTTGAADGAYDLRAVLTDKAGQSVTSAVVVNRRVDNTPPRGFDVQTSNGGTTAGRLDPGDALILTYSEQMRPSTISSGWDGSALGVSLRLSDGASNDTIDILRGGSAVNLGVVNLHEDYVSNNQTAEFAATMTATTATVNGVTATRITITLGAVTSGSSRLRTTTRASTMIWVPSSLASDLAGLGASTTAVSETGAADLEF